MALAFLNFDAGDDGKLEDDEIRLGEPDVEAEALSLPVHVDKCARRYRVTIRRLNKVDRLLGRVVTLLLILLGWQVLTSPQFSAVLAWLK